MNEAKIAPASALSLPADTITHIYDFLSDNEIIGTAAWVDKEWDKAGFMHIRARVGLVNMSEEGSVGTIYKMLYKRKHLSSPSFRLEHIHSGFIKGEHDAQLLDICKAQPEIAKMVINSPFLSAHLPPAELIIMNPPPSFLSRIGGALVACLLGLWISIWMIPAVLLTIICPSCGNDYSPCCPGKRQWKFIALSPVYCLILPIYGFFSSLYFGAKFGFCKHLGLLGRFANGKPIVEDDDGEEITEIPLRYMLVYEKCANLSFWQQVSKLFETSPSWRMSPTTTVADVAAMAKPVQNHGTIEPPSNHALAPPPQRPPVASASTPLLASRASIEIELAGSADGPSAMGACGPRSRHEALP